MSEINQKNKSNKVSKNILIAFLLNFGFSIYELIGGFLTGSVAISSDAIHDFGDAMSIGVAYVLERKSRKKPDEKYSYGYARYSVLGGLITSVFFDRWVAACYFSRGGKIFCASRNCLRWHDCFGDYWRSCQCGGRLFNEWGKIAQSKGGEFTYVGRRFGLGGGFDWRHSHAFYWF